MVAFAFAYLSLLRRNRSPQLAKLTSLPSHTSAPYQTVPYLTVQAWLGYLSDWLVVLALPIPPRSKGDVVAPRR